MRCKAGNWVLLADWFLQVILIGKKKACNEMLEENQNRVGPV